jgi:elongator complex protein 4
LFTLKQTTNLREEEEEELTITLFSLFFLSVLDSIEEVGEAFRDYAGLFHLRKVPFRVNCLSCHLPEQLVYTFRLKRKKLWIEKIHLPPEISRTTGKVGEENERISKQRKSREGLLCQPGLPEKNPFDF